MRKVCIRAKLLFRLELIPVSVVTRSLSTPSLGYHSLVRGGHINRDHYEGLHRLGFQNVANGLINRVATLTEFSYKKMCGCFQGC